MYLFDSDVLSQLAKKLRPEILMAKLAGTPLAAQFTSAVNVAEIYYGIFRMKDQGNDRRRLLEFFENLVFPRLTILPFDEESARTYARLRSELERKGRPRFEPDLQIAAIALRNRLTVVTGNVRHFAGIPGLKVENWLGT
ncbi:MAG TPA: type II toxin-antitoxin system VapC family toxin [Candidatus Latescibacteria bacterium]|nr:type II toxin-antitoxin system VapC family toxin [Candidatus Latescibacterota bacterium]